jgi:hypothetical protein
MADISFDKMLMQRIEDERGKYIPIKASAMERFTVKHVDPDTLHVNPDDEFCFKDIGPSFRIIQDYVNDINHMGSIRSADPFEPLIVEKTSPDGYMLLNGHHRWAAAMKAGLKAVPIKIVNLALESDIKTMLENSKHDKRVTMDLDEVIFRNEGDPELEEEPKSAGGAKLKKRIRKGIPSLFHHLNKTGFDVWVYSADYYSIDDIKDFFERYAVSVNGIITGTGGERYARSKAAKEMLKLIDNNYEKTIHIDNDMLVVTKDSSSTGEFQEYDIPEDVSNWAVYVVERLGEIDKNE